MGPEAVTTSTNAESFALVTEAVMRLIPNPGPNDQGPPPEWM